MRVYPAVPPYSQNSLKKSTDTLATLPNYVSDVDLEKKGGDDKKSKSLSTLLAGKSGKRNQHGSLISVASGEKRYIRWARQHRKCLRYCGVCLILFGVFNAVMFTVGIKWIANYVLNNLYPPTFDLAQYPLTSVQIGPVTDDDVRVKFRVPVPPGLPVSVSLQGAVAIEIYTCAPPESTVEEYYSRDINQQYTGSSNITHNRTAINPQHPQGRCDRQSELLVGLAESLTQSIDIPASGPNVFAEMELLLRVPASSGRAFEFLVSNILSAERSTAIRNSSNTTLPSGYETPLDASNVTIFDSQLLDTTTIRIQMTLPCIKVLFLCIYDLQVDKYVLLQDKSLNYYNQTAYTTETVGGLFALISRGLVGDGYLMQYAGDYMHLSDLQLYDAAAGYPLPIELTALSADEFQFFDSRPTFNASGGAQPPPGDSPIYAGISWRPNVTSNAPPPPLLPGLGGDTGSMPFSIRVHFNNPSAVHLKGIENICVHLNYTNHSIANITIPSVEIGPKGNSSFMLYGYVRSTNPENVLSTDLINSLLAVMVSQKFNPLSFSLTGCHPLAVPTASNGRNHSSRPVWLTVQRMLSNRVVLVGNFYNSMGPLTDATDYRTLAINRIFSQIPVLGGQDRLGAVLQGLKLYLGVAVIGGKIPVSISLANPFNTTITVESLSIRVFLNHSTQTPVGVVILGSPITLPPQTESGVLRNTTKYTAPPAQATFNVDFAIIGSLGSTLQYLTSNSQQNPQPFVITLAFDWLHLRIGRFALRAEDFTLVGVPLVPAWVMQTLPGVNGMMGMFTQGWNMIVPETSAYNNYTAYLIANGNSTGGIKLKSLAEGIDPLPGGENITAIIKGIE